MSEADQRHADLIIRETGVKKLSPLSHPGGEKKTIEEEERSEELKVKRLLVFEPWQQGLTIWPLIGRTSNTQ